MEQQATIGNYKKVVLDENEMFTPTHNYIAFYFVDDEEEVNGFKMAKPKWKELGVESRGRHLIDRWGMVVAVGPLCEEVAVGDKILVETGYWTDHFDYKGMCVRLTDEQSVLLVDGDSSYHPVTKEQRKTLAKNSCTFQMRKSIFFNEQRDASVKSNVRMV